MKIIFLFLLLSLNIFSIDFKKFVLKVNDFDEMKILDSKLLCKKIEDNFGKDCHLKLKVKLKEGLDLIDSLIYIEEKFENKKI